MSQTFRLTLAQLNPTVGAIEANIALALEAWEQGRAAGAQMVALTEMFVTGYQTQDLILKPAFAVHAERAVADLARQIVDGPALGIGGPLTRDGQLTSLRAARSRRPC
jgi:NAD+ synthase